MSTANSSRACGDAKPGVEILRDLWRSELDILLATIANGRRNHEEIHRSAQHVSSDYQGRFLIELIQNANDQARLASLEASTVKVLRTENFVAVSNEGLPFDARKVHGVTSIFLSDKPPDLCIGNKGIGFKAVFEIAEEAEIYSAASGADLAEECSLAFRIVREPIVDPELRTEFTQIAQRLLDRNPDRAEALLALRPDVAPIDQMLAEAAKAAWFKFPLPADHARLIAHLAEAGLGRGFLQRCQTIVLLPIRRAARSQRTVSGAVSEIVGKIDETAGGSINAAPAMLFLDGVTRLEVADRVAGVDAVIERHPSAKSALLAGSTVLDRCVITQEVSKQTENEGVSTQTFASHWWIARRTLGNQTGGDSTGSEAERKAIRDAIATLDLPANWHAVETALMAVAIPVPGDETASSPDWCSPLSADGHFCIGLPTKVATGTPFWVDAHFHGSIARTEIEFEKNEYNALLLRGALGLVSVLVAQLKVDDRIGIRRCATLAMRRGLGRLADMLHAPGGLAASEVVLGEDGREFVRATELRMPRREDLEAMREIVSSVGDVSAYGLCLPDRLLLESARDLIDALAGDAPVAVDYGIYTRRPDGLSLSLVEEAAKRNRHGGPKFWNNFLKWLLDRFQPIEPLLDQRILPIGRDDLETPSARVFLPPMTVTSPDPAAQDAKPAAVDDDDEAELEAIDDDIAERLRFLDDQAVDVRAEKASERTKLARRLAPNVGEGLVRQPRRADLINHALAPALRRSTSQRDAALRLLRQAIEWLMLMNPTTQRRVRVGELLVPVSSTGGEHWEWVAPDSVYLGTGWQDGQADALLTVAYGRTRQLVPWPEFERETKRVFRETERKWWVAGMRRLCVESVPRIICAKQNVSPFESRNYQLLSKEVTACPLPQAAKWWPHWLTAIHSQKPGADWGRQDYFLSEISWIDGLEDDARRPVVFELMLRHAHHYLPHVQTQLARSKGGDSRDVPAFWLEGDQRDHFSHLPAVRPEFGAARELLAKLGVISLDESSPPRLVDALHSLAESLPSLAPERLKSATIQAADLYARIDQRLGAQHSVSSIENLAAQPVPLEHNRRIEAVKLTNVGSILVDDDPLRRQHLVPRDEEWSIPRSRRDLTHLTQALRVLLGTDKVIRVSELPTSIEFTQSVEPAALLQYLRENFPEHPVDVDLALLIIVQGTSISGEYFKRLWSIVSRTQLRRGKFGDGFAMKSWFDQRSEGGPTLMVDADLDRCDVVGAIWQLIGPAYRDIWGNYALVLRCDPSQTAVFFAERGATEADRSEAEANIDRNFERRFSEFQGVVLALWRRSPRVATLERFHDEWRVQAKSPRAMSDWVGNGNLGELLLTAEQRGGLAGIFELLYSHGLSVGEWQQARKDLGQAPYLFAESVRLFEAARDAISTRIMAWAAFTVARATPERWEGIAQVDLARLREWVETLRCGAAPTDVREAPLDETSAIAAAARHALSIADEKPAGASILVEMRALLASLANQPQASIKDIQLAKERAREAAVYLDSPEVRAAQAHQTMNGILVVAKELALKLGEFLDSGKVEADTRVAFLSRGWWANRYSVLAALSRAIFDSAPKTAERMREKKAFFDLENWRALWVKFEELGALPPEAPQQPEPELNLFGLTLAPNDFAQRAAEIARRMDENADGILDLTALHTCDRNSAQLPQPRKRGRRGGGGGGRRTSNEEREIIGAMGEWFVYRQLRSQFDDFDSIAWCSKAKHMFGMGNDGDDGLGYDFKYRDSTGRLTGRSEGPVCLIEVKATTGDGSQPFEMSANEWDVAQQCHTDPTSGLYVVIRVVQITTSPRIADVLIDPLRLYAMGQLTYAKTDLLIYVGNRQ